MPTPPLYPPPLSQGHPQLNLLSPDHHALFPLEEYCTTCGTPQWFLRKGDIVSPYVDPLGVCRCTWHCCPACEDHDHPFHRGLRRRQAGVYGLSPAQIARVKSLNYKNEAQLHMAIQLAVPALFFTRFTVTYPFTVMFDEEDVLNYTTGMDHHPTIKWSGNE